MYSMSCTECNMPGAMIIAKLQPGDKVVIRAGAGDPAQAEDATDHILAVEGFSALTAGGIGLSCRDGGLITVTGESVPVDQLEISSEALEKWEEIQGEPLIH